MTARAHTLTRGLAAVAAAAALTVAGASSVAADPPPAAAGTTTHGFLATRGVVTPIDHPDATAIPAAPGGVAGTETSGINDRGQVLGKYEGQDRVVRHFVRDRKGRYTEIEDPPDGPDGGAFDEPIDINNHGEIVGWYNDDQGSVTSGFLRTAKGRFVDVDVPGSRATAPFKINDRRQIAGLYIDGDAEPTAGGTPPGVVHGFLWDDGEFETVDVPGAVATVVYGINNRGQMVGSYVDAEGAYHGFVRDRSGRVITLPEAPAAEPTAGGTQPASINERGQVVGLAYDARGGSRAFLYERGQFRLFDGTPDAAYTRALDVNSRGQIVGGYGTRHGGASTVRSAADPMARATAMVSGRRQPFASPGVTDMIDAGSRRDAATWRSWPPAAEPDGAGGFLYRKGRFTPLARIPGAGDFQIHYALNDRGETTGSYVEAGAVLGPDGTYPGDAIHAFVKDRRGRITSFDIPGEGTELPQGINDRGQIAGIYLDDNGVQTGFVRDRDGKVKTIALSAIGTKARDVNDRGDVVGIYGEPADNELGYVIRGYLRDRQGRASTIALPGAAETSPYAIDDRGRIVGSYFDAGVVVGPDGSYPPGTLHGFIRDHAGRVTSLDVLGSVATVAFDVDDRGRVVGGYIDAKGRQHGFLYDRGRYTVIDAPRPLDPFAMGSIATGINDRGEIVVPEPVTALSPPREAS